MKLVISDPKTGKTYQTELPKEREGSLVGMKIGDSLDAGIAGASGYKLQITGGSDSDGFPMRPDVKGPRKMGALLSDGPGFQPKERGERRRKTVRGSTVSDAIVQLNTKVVEYGQKPLDELFPSAKKEEKTEETPAEEKKGKKKKK